MEVWNGLATIPAIVEDNPESGFGNPEVFRNARCGEKEVPDQSGILRFSRSNPGKQLFGNDENVDWGLGLDVPDGETKFILVKKLRRDFPCSNFLKKRHRSQVNCK